MKLGCTGFRGLDRFIRDARYMASCRLRFGVPNGIPRGSRRWRASVLSEKVFSRLKEFVFSNHFRPGERLLDRDLARLLGVSRTPVREALVRLHQDGLLETRDGRGYFVIDIQDARHIGDLYDLREVLEVHAVHLAAERARPEDLDELGELLPPSTPIAPTRTKRGEEVKLGLKVHEIIARASGNAFLHETLDPAPQPDAVLLLGRDAVRGRANRPRRRVASTRRSSPC